MPVVFGSGPLLPIEVDFQRFVEDFMRRRHTVGRVVEAQSEPVDLQSKLTRRRTARGADEDRRTVEVFRQFRGFRRVEVAELRVDFAILVTRVNARPIEENHIKILGFVHLELLVVRLADADGSP